MGNFLAIDLGTSAVKVALVSDKGYPVAYSSQGYPTIHNMGGQAEQNTNDWIQALIQAIKECNASASTHLEAVVLTGQLPTLVAIKNGDAIGNAITWEDNRADVWVEEHISEQQKKIIYTKTGMPIDGRYLAPMYRFHFQDENKSVDKILSAKDYIYFLLTDKFVTDPSTAAGYGLYSLNLKTWDADLLDLWAISPTILPEIHLPQEAVGSVTSQASKLFCLPKGCPVYVGAADSVCGAFALSSFSDRKTAVVISGSSTVIMDTLNTPILDPNQRYLLTPHVNKDTFGREMDLLATGSAVKWLCEIFSLKHDQLINMAQMSQTGANGIMFSPYLAGGEQGAIWNPNAPAALVGLTLRTTMADIARSLIEGIVFEISRCIMVLLETNAIENIVLSSPNASDKLTPQILSDVLNMPVVPAIAKTSVSALGALLAIGAISKKSPVITQLFKTPYVPGQHNQTYNALFSKYKSYFPLDSPLKVQHLRSS